MPGLTLSLNGYRADASENLQSKRSVIAHCFFIQHWITLQILGLVGAVIGYKKVRSP